MSRASKIISEMAFSRSRWIDRVRDNFLDGALGEYAKLVIAREIDKPDNWSNEVQGLLEPINDYMDPTKIKSKDNFKRIEDFKEALFEASTYQFQITSAKNEMVRYHPKYRKRILQLKISSRDLIIAMVKDMGGKRYCNLTLIVEGL